MKSLRFTVYELLGYCAPGGVIVLGVYVIGWSAFFPMASPTITGVHLTKEAWILLLVAAYTAGHFVQGICNFHPNGERMFERNKKNHDVLQNAREALERRCEVEVSSYSCSKLVGLCQTLLLHGGKMDDHDVFLYREGYYRGSSASFILLAFACIFRASRAGVSVIANDKSYALPTSMVVCLAVLSFAIGLVFYQRYRRFASYRVTNLLNFACLPKDLLLSKSTLRGDTDSDDSDSADKEDSQEAGD